MFDIFWSNFFYFVIGFSIATLIFTIHLCRPQYLEWYQKKGK